VGGISITKAYGLEEIFDMNVATAPRIGLSRHPELEGAESHASDTIPPFNACTATCFHAFRDAGK
jgi:hypothetical protein